VNPCTCESNECGELVPNIHFTPNLRKHIECPSQSVTASTLRDALDVVFCENPRLRSYVLNDQGHLRQHVAIFIDSRMVSNRIALDDPVTPDSEIYVMQALSGG